MTVEKKAIAVLTFYVGLWFCVTTALGGLALVRWSLRTLGWLP